MNDNLKLKKIEFICWTQILSSVLYHDYYLLRNQILSIKITHTYSTVLSRDNSHDFIPVSNCMKNNLKNNISWGELLIAKDPPKFNIPLSHFA